jgi:hypothetical protein
MICQLLTMECKQFWRIIINREAVLKVCFSPLWGHYEKTCGYTWGVLGVYFGCTLGVLLVYFGCTWGVLGVYLGCTWGVLGVYFRYTWGIFGVYLGWIYRVVLDSFLILLLFMIIQFFKFPYVNTIKWWVLKRVTKVHISWERTQNFAKSPPDFCRK